MSSSRARELELRKYLSTLPYSKRQRTREYQELRELVYARHVKHNNRYVCASCNHECHACTPHGDCHVQFRTACACKRCTCPECDLRYHVYKTV